MNKNRIIAFFLSVLILGKGFMISVQADERALINGTKAVFNELHVVEKELLHATKSAIIGLLPKEEVEIRTDIEKKFSRNNSCNYSINWGNHGESGVKYFDLYVTATMRKTTRIVSLLNGEIVLNKQKYIHVVGKPIEERVNIRKVVNSTF
ncbi:hypothetical protein [Oceanirhabdus sp. W0125-5]|uniref:hypothetical protein n=1 Tax=Oceanirhabdus sp. W0125-5 TaxID=2999116 RepID=UPI0022F33709|nr:hypothetical protein [Oceanirhabdus sp. W0125-5]WBW97760.1 hypothetical protein OW730_02975 [Oceanirhabdus sp. W0125-5]